MKMIRLTTEALDAVLVLTVTVLMTYGFINLLPHI